MFGHQYAGNEELRPENYMLIPGGMGRPYGEDVIDFFQDKYKPDLMCWLCDAFMINWIRSKKKGWLEKKPDMKTLFYFPLDSEDIYDGFKETLENMDYRIAMSKFGQKFVKKETGLDSLYIPHCCDTNTFYPISQEEKDKLKKQNNMEGKFVIGMSGRNQSRKNPVRLLPILQEVFKQHEDAIALFHCDPFDPQGHNLVYEATKLGIGDKIKFTGMKWYCGVPEQVLNTVYNVMDVMCLPTTGEGFGITTIESMACNVPPIVTDYTSSHEIIIENGQCGELVPYSDYIHGGYNTKRVLPDMDEFVKKINKLYDKPKLREKYGQIGREKVMNLYSVQNVLPQWVQVMKNILEMRI